MEFNGAQSSVERVIWVTPILGRNGKLMYMAPLLDHISSLFSSFSVFTGEYDGPREDLRYEVHIPSKLRRFYGIDPGGYATGFTLLFPNFLLGLVRAKPNLIILNEFGLSTFYGVVASMFIRGCKTLLLVESKPWQQGGWLMLRLRRLFRALMMRNVDAILTNNTAGAEYCMELRAPATKVIAGAYLVSQLSGELNSTRRALLSQGATLRFLYVGELIPRKGIETALEAFGQLANHPQRKQFQDYSFDIVGDGPHRQVIEDCIQRHKLTTRVHLHGRMEYDHLVGMYGSAHVFLFPTERDYRALAPFEAISMGLAILGSSGDGGHVENVIDGKNGYVFKPGDVDALTYALSNILSNPLLVEEFSKESLKIAKKFNIDVALGNFAKAVALAVHGDGT